jgi:hypothetical protein
MTESNDRSLGSTTPSAAQKRAGSAGAAAAYRGWVELTAAEPSNQEAWIGRAEAAQDVQEKIASLNRALELNPANGFARRALHACMQQLLGRDARLAYRGETSTFYQLRTPAQFEFTHPKDREALDPYPPVQMTSANAVYRWLKWSMIGLIPAGLGTVLFAPVVIVGAVTLLRHPLERSDTRRMWAAILCGAVLWIVALALVFLLALHLS